MPNIPWTTILDDRFRSDRQLRKLICQLCELEDKLKALANEETWSVYLKLEEVGTLRLCRMVEIAAEEGLRRGSHLRDE